MEWELTRQYLGLWCSSIAPIHKGAVQPAHLNRFNVVMNMRAILHCRYMHRERVEGAQSVHTWTGVVTIGWLCPSQPASIKSTVICKQKWEPQAISFELNLWVGRSIGNALHVSNHVFVCWQLVCKDAARWASTNNDEVVCFVVELFSSDESPFHSWRKTWR